MLGEPVRARSKPRWIAAIGAALLVAALAGPADAQLKTEVVTIDVRPGVTVKYLELRGSEPPASTVILFAGGDGVLGLQPSGGIGTDLGLNFLIRSRERFVREVLAVAALDTASDLRKGMNGDIRLSAQHARDVARVIAALKQRIERRSGWRAPAAAPSLPRASRPGLLNRSRAPMGSSSPRPSRRWSKAFAAGPCTSHSWPRSACRCWRSHTATTAAHAVPAAPPRAPS